MANSINTLQQLLIRDAANTTLQQYNDQVNRRLAALANLGQRYGQEGPGFYIETVTLAKLYALADSVGYVRITAQDGAYAGVELHGPNASKELLENEPYTVPSFMDGFFREVINAFTSVYNDHGVQYSDHYSDSSGIPDYFVELSTDSVFHVVYDSSTNLPIRFAQPFQVFSSAAYVTGEETPLFTAQFTVVTNVTEYEITGASVNTTFVSTEYGLSVTEDGSVYFNGEPTEISLRGAAGASTGFMEVTSDIWLNNREPVLQTARFFSQYSADGDALDTDDFIILPQNGMYRDSNYLDVYAPVPSQEALTRAYNATIEPGTVLMSFANILSSEYGTIDRVCSTIWIHESSDSWKPITSASDSSLVLTFQDFISEDSLVRRIEKDMEQYIAGAQKNDSGEYFRFDTVRFMDSKPQVQNNSAADNVVYSGNQTLCATLRKSLGTGGGHVSILDVYFENSKNKTVRFQEELYANLGTSGVPARKNTGDDADADEYSPELPLVHVKNAGLYKPSVVDEVNVYGVGEHVFKNISAASHAGVPYVTHNALGSFWKETTGPSTSTDIFQSYLEYDDVSVSGKSARYHVGTYPDSGWAGRLCGNLASIYVDGNEETAEDPGKVYDESSVDSYPDSVVLRNTQGVILTTDSKVANSTILSRHVLQMRRGSSSGFVRDNSSSDTPEVWRDNIETSVRVTPDGVTVVGTYNDSTDTSSRSATLVSDGIKASHDFSVYSLASHNTKTRQVHAKVVCFIPKFVQVVDASKKSYALECRTETPLGNQGYWYYAPQCPRYGIHKASGSTDIRELNNTRIILEYNNKTFTVCLQEAIAYGYIDADDSLRWHTATASEPVYVATNTQYAPIASGYQFLEKIYFPILNEEPAITSQPDAMLPDLTKEINRRTFSMPPYPPKHE